MAGSGLLFARSVLGIYASFLTWGYLQERVTAVDYLDSAENPRRFKNVIFLNLAMGIASALVAFVAQILTSTKPTTAPFTAFAEVSLSNTLASPIGYASLAYISFPMLTLAKASKLLPIMAMGILISKTKYSLQKYVSALLITAGIALFSYKPKPAKGEVAAHLQLFGLGLVLCNLLMDGYTNARQEHMFKKNKTITGMHMMCYLNTWTVIYIGIYMLVSHSIFLYVPGVLESSELGSAMTFLGESPDIIPHIIFFALMGAVGQVFIFITIKDFGALVTTTICLTRKFWTILISIFYYNHTVVDRQWAGIAMVFVGLSSEVYYKNKARSEVKEEDKKK